MSFRKIRLYRKVRGLPQYTRYLTRYDKCVEPNQLKVKAKALKELKKIEKAEDKCTKNYEKGIKKCAKKKGKKQISCCEKSFLKINKCLNKVKKMRKKL